MEMLFISPRVNAIFLIFLPNNELFQVGDESDSHNDALCAAIAPNLQEFVVVLLLEEGSAIGCLHEFVSTTSAERCSNLCLLIEGHLGQLHLIAFFLKGSR